MLNVTHTLDRMEISATSVSRAIQETREILSGSTDLCKAATNFIRKLLSLEVKFDNPDVAQTTAVAVVEAAVRANGEIGDEEALLKSALARAEAFVNKPENGWMFAKPEAEVAPQETRAVEDTDLKVVVKSDGKIKRGGKQQIAGALFKKYVTESATPCDNACFVRILQKEAGMTLAGARTYAHSLRAKNGMVTSRPAK